MLTAIGASAGSKRHCFDLITDTATNTGATTENRLCASSKRSTGILVKASYHCAMRSDMSWLKEAFSNT